MTDLVPAVERLADNSIHSKVYARIGLLGNPSDGYGGRCLSFSLANFWAEVFLTPAADGDPYGSAVEFQPNPENDPQRFQTMDHFMCHFEGNGYYGGLRLLQAMVLVFARYCKSNQISLDTTRGFSLAYRTTIPRQRGLGGSSAIACAALNCLLEHYGVARSIPFCNRPQLVLDAEQQLGIAAGLQDRVTQVFGGLVFMDFSDTINSSPPYISLEPSLLPTLHLIYGGNRPSGKNSGTVHSTFAKRWNVGDPQLEVWMNELKELPLKGIDALWHGKKEYLASLMKTNFQLRRQLFGDDMVGEANFRMVGVASSVGAAAKLTGSGGAIVALCFEGEEQVSRLKTACLEAGLECMEVELGPRHHIVP